METDEHIEGGALSIVWDFTTQHARGPEHVRPNHVLPSMWTDTDGVFRTKHLSVPSPTAERRLVCMLHSIEPSPQVNVHLLFSESLHISLIPAPNFSGHTNFH